MAKYQSITIRRSPEHVRPLMKIVNEMDKQMKRFQKAIEEQIEIAESYQESERTITGLRYSLDRAKKRQSASEPDPLAPPPDIEDTIDLEIPDFNSPKPNSNYPRCPLHESQAIGLCIACE